MKLKRSITNVLKELNNSNNKRQVINENPYKNKINK